MKLSLLGSPTLEMPSGTVTLERKTAAVLAYLAIEGATPKYKLAGWLWPDSGEGAARNNMRQLLRRLRLRGADLVAGDERLELRAEVEPDVKGVSYLQIPSLELLRRDAVLLDGLDFDDAPDFAEWLEATREELRRLSARTAEIEANRLEGAGRFKAGLEFALARLKLEPLSEEAYRQVARLHYLLGDRGAALSTLRRCQEVLLEELGSPPVLETLVFTRLIEQGADLPDAPKRPSQTIPVSVLRPPVLAGRERAWADMEAAWAAGKIIFLSSEAGVGKSRLAADFLGSKGTFVRLEGRPGDSHVPYASHFRYLRTLLARYPEFVLPEWAHQALAPLMPELGFSPSPELARSPGGQNRFAEASLEIFTQIGLRGEGLLADDLHFTDASTSQIGAYLLATAFPLGAPGKLRGYVGCSRRGELPPEVEAAFGELVAGGVAVQIELEPLTFEGVQTLLAGLDLVGAEGLTQGLSRYTGGNPLFILETLRYLIETDALEAGLPARLTPPGRVASLIGRRLQRLSPAALNLARVAAVSGTQFSLALASSVLERHPLEVADALSELEQAQVLRGERFSHDLLFETVHAGIPAAVKALLHARTATRLEAAGANPAVIAQHWLEAGQAAQAVPWLLASARLSEASDLFSEAADAYGRAGEILASQGNVHKAAALQTQAASLHARAANG